MPVSDVPDVPAVPVPISGEQRAAYAAALQALNDAGIEFLIGGGFAMHQYLGRWRSTKDLDLFIRARDVKRSLATLSAARFRVELTDTAWLAKAFRDGIMVDIIFSSYNGLFPVNDRWFENRRASTVLGVEVQLVGPEEMIVSKAFVAARDRFDGSDVSWLIRTLHGQGGPRVQGVQGAQGLGPDNQRIDWARVESHMAAHWEVLLWQLIHFRYVFPEDRHKVPDSVVERLLRRMSDEIAAGTPAEQGACRGPMLDPIHYLAAVLERKGELEKSVQTKRELVSREAFDTSDEEGGEEGDEAADKDDAAGPAEAPEAPEHAGLGQI